MGRFVVRLSHAGFAGTLLTVLVVLAAALLPARASGQGILLVRVTGAGGQPLENATVQVAFGGTVMRTAGTDPKGAARMTGLAAGSYDITVGVLGYKSRTYTNVRVENRSVRVLDVSLQQSAVELEGITAQSQRIQIQHENTDFGIQIEKKAIELLPMTYQVENLVALTPGARPGHVWGGANFQADSYTMDGVSTNNPGMGGDAIQPNINWIDKVEVRGLGAGAEYGGFQGGLIDITTKRGTNDFQGFFKTSYENQALDASNLVGTQIGSEIESRHDMEAEARGPIVRDKLFYYVSGKYVRQDSRVLNHLNLVEGKYSPMKEPEKHEKAFGKLTWTPGPRSTVEASAAYLGVQADNYGITGYEEPGAAQRYTSPTWLVNGTWTETLGGWGVWEARVNRFTQDERYTPYGGMDVPGISTFALWPPYSAYGNSPYFLRSAPSSTSAHSQLSLRLHTGSWEHTLKVGVDYTKGSFINRRLRSGGMTWQPSKIATYTPDDPNTWHVQGVSWIATQWGGEVNLDAQVANTAAYAQSSIQVGPWVVLSPGVRWNQWQGWLTPQSGNRFLAVQDRALDPRMGITVNLSRDKTLVLKGHWGRYHQDMITQMFDRAAGSDVFTNQEVWYYHGVPTSPTQTFTVQQRDSLAALGIFTKETVQSLNETGPVENYHQPYIDEWLFGLQKQVGSSVKLQALYTRRTNHDMVALVDRNAASNYTMFRYVRVYDASNQPVAFSGGSVWLDRVYLPNYVVKARLICSYTTDCPGVPPIPNMTIADTAGLTWNPDYVLTNAPSATRTFGQFQLTVDVSRPTWGGSFSFVLTSLKGNLDNVSGYVDPTTYDAGPYVHVNEGVDAYGYLPNFAGAEGKVSVWGNLPWNMRGGAFWTYRSGDHYSPQFRVTSLGIWTYRANSGALLSGGQPLDYRLFYPLEGEYMFVGPRGLPQLEARSNVDLHLERLFDLRGERLSVALDAFNVLGEKSVTQLNTMVNNGQDYYPDLAKPWTGVTSDQYYMSVLQRVQPRILRFSLTVFF
ncbi:MAG: TonB-dependent receptor [Gemmatimonadetes bacterium]|nr:TonB-dependent receptor [Gemmatimonadota bacterium]